MLKRLRLKFLWGSTLVLLLVIALVVSIIYWATSHTITRQTQVFIDLILENGGVLPEQNVFDPRQQAFLALNDESIHEARYFSVRFFGEVEALVSIRIAALSKENAIDLAEKVLDTSSFFERFYRQDESHNSGKPGFGIGLSMAKEITERLKGKIRVDYSVDTISLSVEL